MEEKEKEKEKASQLRKYVADEHAYRVCRGDESCGGTVENQRNGGSSNCVIVTGRARGKYD